MLKKIFALGLFPIVLTGCAALFGMSSSVQGAFDEANSICVTWTTPGKLACDFTYTLTNNSDSPVTISVDSIFAEADGQTFQAVPEDQIGGSVYTFSVTLNPGETRFARTGFQIPDGATISKLRLSSAAGNGIEILVGVTTEKLYR